jgi:integrase
MHRKSIDFNFIRPANTIPHFFDENDIARIFAVCSNLKHLSMLQTLFYGCLRASELCNLDDCDLDLKSLSLRVEGKGGRESIVYITDDCAKILKRYLEVRAPIEIDGRNVGSVAVSIACSCTTSDSLELRNMVVSMYSLVIAWVAFW